MYPSHQLSSPRLDAPPRQERRKEPRYEPARFRSWVGWREGDEFHVEAVSIADISRGGVQLVSVHTVPVGVKVWFCVDDAGQAPTVTGQVLDSARARRGYYRVRVTFDEPCPEALMDAAVLGVRPD